MGTNYDYKLKPCPTCGTQEILHIGKDSTGCVFSFQAYKDIRSFSHWIDYINEHEGIIIDEYGREVKLSEFIKIVTDTKNALHNHSVDYPDEHNFVDKEGYSFSEYNFS